MAEATMDSERSRHLVVYVTTPRNEAPALANALVERRLAACVNIVPGIRSVYLWKGELCDEGETLLVIKTRAALFEALRDAVVELHSYEVPEVVALPIVGGHPPYLAWVDESTNAEK